MSDSEDETVGNAAVRFHSSKRRRTIAADDDESSNLNYGVPGFVGANVSDDLPLSGADESEVEDDDALGTAARRALGNSGRQTFSTEWDNQEEQDEEMLDEGETDDPQYDHTTEGQQYARFHKWLWNEASQEELTGSVCSRIWSVAHLTQLFAEQKERWLPPGTVTRVAGGIFEFFIHAFELNALDCQMSDVTMARKRKVYELGQMMRLMGMRGLLNIDEPEGIERKEELRRIFRNVSNGGDHVQSGTKALINGDTERFRDACGDDVEDTHFIFQDPSTEAAHPIRAAFEHVLKNMQEHGVRRQGDQCFSQIMAKCPEHKIMQQFDGETLKQFVNEGYRDNLLKENTYVVTHYCDKDGNPSKHAEYCMCRLMPRYDRPESFPEPTDGVPLLWPGLSGELATQVQVLEVEDVGELDVDSWDPEASEDPLRSVGLRVRLLQSRMQDGDEGGGMSSGSILRITAGDVFERLHQSPGYTDGIMDDAPHAVKYFCPGQRFATHAWKPSGTIEEFVYGSLRKELNFRHYCYFRASGSNSKYVIQWLSESHELEFEDLVQVRSLFAFYGDKDGMNGGLYDLAGAFFPYNKREQWPEIARRVNEWWKKHKHGAKSRRPIQCSGSGLNGSPGPMDVASNLFYEPFDERWADLRLLDHDFAVSDLHAIDRDLHAKMKFVYGGDFDYSEKMDRGWRAIESIIDNEDIDRLLLTQNMNPRTRLILMALLGRGLVAVKKRENWQVMLFLKGVGGSGKSTLLDFLQSLLPDGKCGVIANAQEQTFGLMSLYDKWLVLWPEAKSCGQILPQSDLQSMICGEKMCIRIKNKGQLFQHWESHIICAGNELPLWQDKQRCMTRRLVIVPYSQRVEKVDTELPERLSEQCGSFLARCNMAYLLLLLRVGSSALADQERPDNPDTAPYQSYLGKTITEATAEVQKALDPVFKFLTEKGFTFGSEYCMPEEDFRHMFNQFKTDCGLAHFNGGSGAWSPDLYMQAFSQFDLTVEENCNYTAADGTQRKGSVIHGLATPI